MKKHIGFISLDSSLAAWLLDKLRDFVPPTDASQELREGVEDLTKGRAGSLMLELKEGEFVRNIMVRIKLLPDND